MKCHQPVEVSFPVQKQIQNDIKKRSLALQFP